MNKVLFLDIETFPIRAYTWGMYEQDVIKKIKPFEIASFAYSWLKEDTKVEARDNQSEKSLLKKLHKILSDSDIVVAHNGDSFDIKKINSRFIIHRFKPPKPYKTIDTKKEAKKVAAFDSNSLENIGLDIGEGEKIKHRGFSMWEGCMEGKGSSWREMKKYNAKDVDLLKKVYKRLRPWIKFHPTTNQNKEACPNCDSTNSQKRGFDITRSSTRQRHQCQDCGAWFQSSLPRNLLSLQKKRNPLVQS